jgi:hypothetical protein
VGVTYYWTAFKAAAGELKLGSYLGDGNDNRNIPGVGFQPDYVLVVPQATAYVWQRSSAMPAGEVTYSFEANSFPNLIQALLADGFQVGNSIDINAGGVTYHYAAWKAIAGKMNVGSYSGNNLDGRSITGVGFRPGYVTVKRAVIDDAMMKPAATGRNTDLSPWFRCYSSCAGTNLIQALETNGFQVGDDIAVNATGETYYWVASVAMIVSRFPRLQGRRRSPSPLPAASRCASTPAAAAASTSSLTSPRTRLAVPIWWEARATTSRFFTTRY